MSGGITSEAVVSQAATGASVSQSEQQVKLFITVTTVLWAVVLPSDLACRNSFSTGDFSATQFRQARRETRLMDLYNLLHVNLHYNPIKLHLLLVVLSDASTSHSPCLLTFAHCSN
ncbi:hypothetical protein CRENBAI_000375 [Crenichthys baileyi]|uniref:Uncharacterized protein n=1 Tax=Crenichthys baileyi TaxID=28760 RepID=A0AAV9SHK6_9TELE